MVALIAYGGVPLCQVDLHGRATKLRANGKRLALASKYTHGRFRTGRCKVQVSLPNNF